MRNKTASIQGQHTQHTLRESSLLVYVELRVCFVRLSVGIFWKSGRFDRGAVCGGGSMERWGTDLHIRKGAIFVGEMRWHTVMYKRRDFFPNYTLGFLVWIRLNTR